MVLAREVLAYGSRPRRKFVKMCWQTLLSFSRERVLSRSFSLFNPKSFREVRVCLRVREVPFFVLGFQFIRPVSVSGVLAFFPAVNNWLLILGCSVFSSSVSPAFDSASRLFGVSGFSSGLSRFRLTDVYVLFLPNRFSFLGLVCLFLPHQEPIHLRAYSNRERCLICMQKDRWLRDDWIFWKRWSGSDLTNREENSV